MFNVQLLESLSTAEILYICDFLFLAMTPDSNCLRLGELKTQERHSIFPLRAKRKWRNYASCAFLLRYHRPFSGPISVASNTRKCRAERIWVSHKCRILCFLLWCPECPWAWDLSSASSPVAKPLPLLLCPVCSRLSCVGLYWDITKCYCRG